MYNKIITKHKYLKTFYRQGLLGYICRIIDYINVLDLPVNSVVNTYFLWFYNYYF